MVNYSLKFDDVILKQLKKSAKNITIRTRLSSIFDKLEEFGPRAGNLLDSRLSLFEVKNKRPPIRLYYKYIEKTNEIYVFEYEIKKSKENQQSLIESLKQKILYLFKTLNLF